MPAPTPPKTYPHKVTWINQAGQKCTRTLKHEGEFWNWHFWEFRTTWGGQSLVERPKQSGAGEDDGLAREGT